MKTMFGAMFWKETRENVLWAILACLGLALGLAYAWYLLPPGPALNQAWSGENLVLTLSTPIIGLALGLLQILPELRRDQWAFLIHRPASQTALFFGKVLPGVCLYLLASILPLLGLAAWESSPHHVPAPFDFRFTLAGWAAVLAGLPFYFAGLLVALRPARWYGSRALPLLSALLAPWAATGLTEFWQVALICLALAVTLFFAAWGSFVTGGEYEAQTKPARFALGLTLYPGVAAVAVGVFFLIGAAYNGLHPSHSQEWWRNDTKIDTQGRIFYTSEHSDSRGNVTQTVTDAAGRAVDPRTWQNLSKSDSFLKFSYLPVGALLRRKLPLLRPFPLRSEPDLLDERQPPDVLVLRNSSASSRRLRRHIGRSFRNRLSRPHRALPKNRTQAGRVRGSRQPEPNAISYSLSLLALPTGVVLVQCRCRPPDYWTAASHA